MHAILGSCQPQQPLLLWERQAGIQTIGRKNTERKMKEGLWAYTIHKTSIILLTKTMTWLSIPNLSPMFLRNWYQEGKRWALCITPTICVFIVTSHCLLHEMNKRDRQKANINIKMEANLSRMKLKLSAERQPVGWHLPFL